MTSTAVVLKAEFLTAPMMALVYMHPTVTIMMTLEWNLNVLLVGESLEIMVSNSLTVCMNEILYYRGGMSRPFV